MSSEPTANYIHALDYGGRLFGGNLVFVSGTDANTTMAVNTIYSVNMSGWATANRTYTLPAVCAVGDVVILKILAGNATYGLIITAGSGDTLNGVSGGTEWSRLFTSYEQAVLRCVVANTTWDVEMDGRIPSKFSARLSTNATGESADTFTAPTAASGVWTEEYDIGGCFAHTTSIHTARRAGAYKLTAMGAPVSAVSDQKYLQWQFWSGSAGRSYGGITQSAATSSANMTFSAFWTGQLAAGDTTTARWRSEEGSKGLLASDASGNTTFFTGEELL